ncbi:MAG: class I SAM-dependent methyltransferase [Frankiaceae bacterium]|nr:class I SAM-dependent methyltransferase [Frankiaceae bacterium]
MLYPPTFNEEQVRQFGSLAEPLSARLDAIQAELERMSGADFDILDAYCDEAPSPQTAVDIFGGEWASKFPEPLAHLRAGAAPLFEIDHVPWGVAALGGVEGRRVVELGPLEGGHTYILDRLGAAEVVAIEANTRAYLKCLISKELLGIPSARFHCGDALRYLEGHLAHGGEKFDLCLASGVLYHFRDPVLALDLMTRASDRLLLWTMYYDHEYIQSRDDLRVKFPDSAVVEHAGYKHTLYRQEYQAALSYKGFCGGSAASSAWMTKSDIFGALEHFGFEILDTGFEEQNHKGNGPCISLVARRRA